MTIPRLALQIALAAGLALVSAAAAAQTAAPPRQPVIHLVYMGGNDCPPCMAWRATELPKLQQSPEFNSARFSYVIKSIKSPVPPAFFLPDEVKPLKEKLDLASGGLSGSPQTAVLVDGEVYDYFRGSRSAEEVLSMLVAIRTATHYPFQRCLKRGRGQCELPG